LAELKVRAKKMSTTDIALFDASGAEVGKKAVASSVFGADVNPHLLHQVVRWQRAKKRAGTHQVKTRAEVRGGGKKPWRQKGLGRARAGSNTSPIWVGGGVAHGPKPRSYEFSLNRKERQAALCGAISARNGEGKCKAITDFGLEKIKTKDAAQVLANLGVERGKKAIVVATEQDSNVVKSLSNIAGVKTLPVEGLNVYDLLNAEFLIVTERSIEPLESRLA
jgi:large subunit ribosomal protein L4